MIKIVLKPTSIMTLSCRTAIRMPSKRGQIISLMCIFLNDVELIQLMRSHQLDVLVELAGHTSTNRLVLFKGNRFAPLQITGIGYPPTTGLSEMDAKILDPYVVGDQPEHYYTEAPLILHPLHFGV